MQSMHIIKQLLEKIYGAKNGETAFQRIQALIQGFKICPSANKERFSQNDVVLITYGDSLQQEGKTPLQAMHWFARKYLKEIFSTIHILPFYPYSSDDGFSVIDYFTVDPILGTWEDVECLEADFDLMFDYVLNHVSAQSNWFRDFLDSKAGFTDLAIAVQPETDLTMVIRPRALPLLTPFVKSCGEQVHLWTTFSTDQIDLNFKSIDVLVKMIEVMLFYVAKGARMLRLDAVAYLWKEIGTSCIHLPQTHDVIRLMRLILDQVASDVLIITETNVPHAENISYFGNGGDEAQMVYNFTLPPLLLNAFLQEDACLLTQWASSLQTPSDDTTFFNFTASHDGIGVRPLEGILSSDKIEGLAKQMCQNGGEVSFKHNPDGSKSPYELNITYVDAFARGKTTAKADHVARFLASQAIQLVLPGVPAVYIHSILGSRNWNAGVQQTGRLRTINREKLCLVNVLKDLEDPNSFRSQVFYAYARLLRIKRAQSALHPNASYEVWSLNPHVFAMRRYSQGQELIALTNISHKVIKISLKPKGVALHMQDLIASEQVVTNALCLQPYQSMWLT